MIGLRRNVYFALLPVVAVGCCQTNPSSPVQRPFYSVLVRADEGYFAEGARTEWVIAPNIAVEVSCFALPRPMQISALLDGGEAVQVYSNSNNSGGPWFCAYFVGTFIGQTITGAKTLLLRTDCGDALSDIVIPAPTTIASHSNNDTVSSLTDIDVAWTGNADWYWVIVAAGRGGQSDTRPYDTVVVTRSFTISAQVLRDSISEIVVDVRGYNGPNPLESDMGNVRGNGDGIVWSTNETTDSSHVFLWVR